MRRLAVVLVIALLVPLQTSEDNGGVGGADVVVGVDQNGVSISGTQTRTAPEGTSPGSSDAPQAPATSEPCAGDPIRITACGIDAVKVTNDEGRPITITDVAQFAPDPVRTIAEPEDVGIAGLPTNVVASASAQTRTGELFDRPVSVRFTPVGYDFDYGDGTTSTRTNGGRTWSALGQAPFTPTPTSHVYRERGTHAAHVSVRYTAEVDIGGGWFSVPGELAVTGSTQEVRIFEAHTALVARTCAEQPGAPGC